MAHADTDEAAGAPRGGSFPTDRTAPHPHPSWGAGGPRQRAAGRVSPGDDGPSRRDGALLPDGPPLRLPPAVLLEPDPLLRPAVELAVRQLGFEPGLAPAPVVFVNLGGLGACPSRSFRRTGCPGLLGDVRPPDARRAAGLVVGYVAGRPLTGAAHALHGCCSQVLELRLGREGPLLTTLLMPPDLELAGPTPREADVLALLLAGATDRVAAATLGVAPSTVRTHARAVLRKVGVADRRSLRRLDSRAVPVSYDSMGFRS